MSKDYYKILGVDKAATQEDVKKAYRRKAHEHHPDKAGGDEAKFKEVNEAYQVLGDAKKRAQYDQFGSAFEHAQAGGGYGGFDGFRDFSGYTNGFNVDMDDLGEIFGGIGDMFGFGSSRRRTAKRRGSDIRVILTLEFSEAVFGAEKEIRLAKNMTCGFCHGNGAEPGSKIETCKVCGGSGRVTRVQRTILGNMQVQTTCEACGGEGKAFTKRCTKCNGSGVVKESVTLNVKIPAGINEGETIRLSGQGEAGEKGAGTGDLYLQMRVRPDSRFTRDGNDIKSDVKINFTQAALGASVDVETVDGAVKLKIPAGTQSGTVFKLRGKGVPKLRERSAFGGIQGKRGDHLVTVIVKTPTGLDKKQKELLEELGRA